MSRRLRLSAAALAGGLATACAGSGSGPPAPGRVVTLDQGWSPATAASVHHRPQGTMIMPTPWLAALDAGPFSAEPLLSKESMRRFGFVVDGPPGASELDPHGLPVGLASTGTLVPVDPENPGDTRTVTAAGFTCAACHTGQLDYRGTAIRIEGGQAYHDARAFQNAIGTSVIATWLVPWKYARFRQRAIALGYPEDKLDARFKTAFDAAWGKFKADRFGREPDLYPTWEGNGRLDALQRIANQLFAEELRVRANNLTGDAPVSYPPLWDIWLFDWVQYNGSVRQPMVRNVGEALGVNALTRFVGADGTANPEPERWRTSVRVRDIDAIENAYQSLRPPRWPEDVLPPIDRAKADAGRALFERRCANCHGVQLVTDRPVRRQPDGAELLEWHLPVVRLDAIGTDPAAAVNFARNRYDATKLGVPEPIGGAAGLRLVAERVKEQAYRDAGIPASEWPALDGFGRDNLVEAPCGYKARPLVGIWATPPFLHNGSVPTLADLLGEERPARFAWGSREFDPVRVGYDTTPGSGAREFDTALKGNGNAGHWFTDDTSRKGRVGPALAEAERAALVEYLKAAVPETYPVRRVTSAEIPPLPCKGEPGWAEAWPQ